MERALKILLLEDSADDVTLIEHELRRAGLVFDCTVATNRAQFVAALDTCGPDVIISDHSLPAFNSIEAFAIYKEHEKTRGVIIPFILVTGNVSEEFAIQSIKAGVDDYILKDRLKRLPMAIQGALEKCHIESERRKYLRQVIAREALMSEAEALAGFGSWEADLCTGEHRWSDATYSIYGFAPGEIDPTYELFLSLVHYEDRAALEDELRAMLRDRDGGEYDFRIIHPNGEVKHLACKIKVQRDATGLPRRLVGFNLDITEKKIAHIALKSEEQKYRSLFHQNPNAVFSLDLQWRFTNVNKAFTDIVARSKEELIGKDFREMLSSELENIYNGFICGRHHGEKQYKTQFTNCRGRLFTLDVTVMDTVVDDEIIGVHCVARDITETVRLETLLDQAYRSARIGGWEVDVETSKLSWTSITHELHEVADDFVPTIDSGLSFYCGESRHKMQHALMSALENGEAWDLELKITTGKGNTRWVRCMGQPELRGGKCVRIYGTLQDIDSRKTAEKKAFEQNIKLREIAHIQSHDVRAPLARLIGLVNLINEEMHQMDELPDLLENIAVSALELDKLIRNIVRKTEPAEPNPV